MKISMVTMRVVGAMLIALLSGCGAPTATYTYDSNGHLTSVAYSNGVTLTYTYDAAGNLLSVQSSG
jgi:YD repeat-containing protein